MEKLLDTLLGYLPVAFQQNQILRPVIGLLLIVAIAITVHFLARLVILRGVEALLTARHNQRDDLLVSRHVFRRLIHIIPAVAIYGLANPLLPDHEVLANAIRTAAMLYMVVMIVLFVDALLNVLLEIYRTFEISKHFPIKSFIQAFKLIAYFIAIVTLISLLLGKSPLQLIAGLGAMTAVLMLVFKDPILGFVAGLQLSSNRMVAIGDWIEIPQHGVDGDVLEIALTTVKVKNFDNTITTVPTQALINDSFKNWAGMQRSGGRRIKRAVHIDMNSIKFCDDETLQRFSRIQYISQYIADKKQELTEFNAAKNIDAEVQANGRRLTNIGTFRAYVQAYLKDHPKISKDLTFLVRQLPPGETGVPIEIYVFCNDTRWVEYESIQGDIFDHVLAVVPSFDLRLFQNPTGLDYRSAFLQSGDGLYASENRR